MRSNAALAKRLRIEQAHAAFFDGEFLQSPAFEPHDDGDFLGSTDRDAKFRILHFAEHVGERIDANAEAILLESVAQFAQIEDAPVHCAAAPLR